MRSQARQGCWVESGAKMVRSMVRRNWAKGGRSWSVLLAAGACACALTLGLSGCVFTTPPRAEVKRERVESSLTSSDLVSEGYLTVAMDTTEAPQAMIETDGTPSGYYADVARALAERLGLDLKVVSSADAPGTLSDGEADIFLGGKSTDDDEEIVIAGNLLEDGSSLFVHNEDGSLESPALDADSLSGAVIAVQGDSASQDALVRGGVTATFKTYSNVNECFEALGSGEVEYVACDATAGAYLARAYPGTVFVATLSSLASYGLILPADGGNLASAVEDALAAIESDGTLDAIYRSWYGSLPFGLSNEQLAGLSASTDDASEDEAVDSGEDGELVIEGDLNALD